MYRAKEKAVKGKDVAASSCSHAPRGNERFYSSFRLLRLARGGCVPRVRRRGAASAVPGTIIALGELASINCFNSSLSIVSFSINRSASATNAWRRLSRMWRTFSSDSSMIRCDLQVDFAGRLLAVAAIAGNVLDARQKGRPAALAIVHPAQAAHAELHDHAAGDFGGALQIVLRAGRHVVENQLFGHRAAQQRPGCGSPTPIASSV